MMVAENTPQIFANSRAIGEATGWLPSIKAFIIVLPADQI